MQSSGAARPFEAPRDRAMRASYDHEMFGHKRRTRREQLIDARAKLSRQIEIMEAGPAYAKAVYEFQPAVIAELKSELAEIEACLAELGPRDP